MVNFRPSLIFCQQSLLAPTASKEEQELGHMKKNVTAHVIWRNFRHAIHNINNKNDDASLIKIVSASTCSLGTNAFPVLKTLFFQNSAFLRHLKTSSLPFSKLYEFRNFTLHSAVKNKSLGMQQSIFFQL